MLGNYCKLGYYVLPTFGLSKVSFLPLNINSLCHVDKGPSLVPFQILSRPLALPDPLDPEGNL